MALTIFIVLAGVIVAWLFFFLFSQRWPLKVAEHTVFCPVQSKPAKIRLLHSQVSFGSYMPVDVSSCSLFPQGPVSCDRQCMSGGIQ
ncbi:MAG TPA: hypothetical protein VE398_22815 [Acidobacteriota bacterium]|nr:hypothetical protein [Acidobacteriota bacterium]